MKLFKTLVLTTYDGRNHPK